MILNGIQFLKLSLGTEKATSVILSVRVGSDDIYKGGDIIQVLEIINHPEYNSNGNDYDFSLIRLLTPIILNGRTKAVIKLPPANDPIKEGSEVFVTGWGETKDYENSNFMLRAVTVLAINQAECAKRYAVNHEVITNRMICASSSGKDSCQVKINFTFDVIFNSVLSSFFRVTQVR